MLKFSVFYRFYLYLIDLVVSLSCKYEVTDIYSKKRNFEFIPFCPKSYKFYI